MNIILIHSSEVKNNRVTLRGRRSEHIRKVLGASCGDTLRTGIINGPMGTSRVIDITAESVELATNHGTAVPDRPLTDLILALPRPIMLKRIFSQATTLGVGRIFLINANRVEKSFFSASLLHEDNYSPHLLHGLEQAVDTRVPEISIHKRFKPFLEDTLPQQIDRYTTRLTAHPGPYPLLPDCVNLPLKQKTVIAIGPEGGWVDYEVQKFQELGFQPFTMGPRILRVDTAVPALLSQLELLRQISC